MFVTDFKKIQVKPKNYPSKVKIYKWDQKTKKLKKQDFDWQEEIDKNKHIELKEMLKKNILPSSNDKGYYADLRPFKDINMHKIYQTATNVMFNAQNKQVAPKQATKQVEVKDEVKKVPESEGAKNETKV